MGRVQLRLGELGLEAVVAEMTQAATRAVCSTLSLPHLEATLAEAVEPAIRGVLSRYAVAFDVCGMSVICDEGEPVDAWAAEEPEQDG